MYRLRLSELGLSKHGSAAPRFILASPHLYSELTRISSDMGQQNPPSGGSRKISFNVSDQYEIQDVIGEGAYGVVW